MHKPLNFSNGPTVPRSNRKASDEDIIRLNSLGLSLATIAEVLSCHPTTITLRLKGLNIEPADTRRSFMEDIIFTLDQHQIEWLSERLNKRKSIKDYVRQLIVQDYEKATKQPPTKAR